MPTQRLPTGIDLYYETHGAGDPIVLSPSTGFSADVWHLYQVPELSKSHQVIIFDPRGVGRTTHYEGVYTIDQMACDLVALLDHLKIDAAHILGHSMGGRVALCVALNYPGRVKSLIMAASGSGAAARPGEECVPGMSFGFVQALVGRSHEEHIRHSILESENYLTADFRERHPDRAQALYEAVRGQHAGWPETLRQTMARTSWEATHRLGDLVVPTLIMVGDRDQSGSNHVDQADQLQARIKDAEFVRIKGCSHGFFWQEPEETNRIILDWLARHAAASPHLVRTPVAAG